MHTPKGQEYERIFVFGQQCGTANHLVGTGLPIHYHGVLKSKRGGYVYTIRRTVIINYQANVLVSYQPQWICLMISFYTSNREITVRNQVRISTYPRVLRFCRFLAV